MSEIEGTPSNKAKVGDKDENISIKECESLIGKNVTEQIAKISIEIYKYAFNYAYQKDIIIADIGHYESEQFTKDLIYDLLMKKNAKFAVQLSKVNTNPIKYL